MCSGLNAVCPSPSWKGFSCACEGKEIICRTGFNGCGGGCGCGDGFWNGFIDNIFSLCIPKEVCENISFEA